MKKFALPLVLAVVASTLVSCSTTSPLSDALSIVASTNVYGSIAEAIVGTHATVTSIIDSPSQDPHSFEAGARVQLELSRADVVIENGGGYDDFVDRLLSGAGNTTAKVITAVDVSGLTSEQIDANEHVWYDLDAAHAVATAIADTLEQLDPKHSADYRSNLAQFATSMTDLTTRVAAIANDHAGENVIVTEPVPLYLLESAGLTDVTPAELSTAIENGNGVPPAVLEHVLTELGSGTVSLFAYNEQTAGPETSQLLSAAKQAGVPAIAVTETIPDGRSYLQWMAANIREIEDALA